MINMLAYDIKKNIRAISILSFISLAFFVILFFTNDLYRPATGADGETIYRATISLVGIHNGVFIVLAILMPFFILKFKMKKITVDQMYALPIKREKLYLEKYLFGLICLFIPYTLSILGAHGVALLNPHVHDAFPEFYYVVPAYFAIAGLLLMFYTFSCLFYSRCNSMLDGILISIGAVFFVTFISFGLVVSGSDAPFISEAIKATEKLNLLYLANYVGVCFNKLIEGLGVADPYIKANMDLLIYIGAYAILAIVAFFAYLYLNKNDKAENATTISNSLLSYKLWIPLYAIGGAILIPQTDILFIPIMVVVIICMYIGILIYLRSVKKMDKMYFIAYGVFLLALIVRLIINFTL